ncbi:Inorganic pyrophosphatase [Wickerhamomyces ciferrii]|uniref:inorganic diphosphatase n=1 Tax=Wickerhamomyces ciferrii (strain ATCC 14091 / BCRC 22168 / CBS 111 / JCM 3599 / NBRC 0793 / NRRL Y-1031 F-60-10) TaxID=1206466 RepID=K0KTI2_WICCF|nr:Inorganic pyrophosphatase [Wickerhamomyces ciferrii]CCH45322.1 Inorganic pyrophosphatase [Wickerhamomyces ciferrii]
MKSNIQYCLKLSKMSAVARLNQTARHISTAVGYNTVTEGSKYSSDFKAYLQLPNGELGSYFHDIPLNLNKEKKTVNVIVEISRWSNAKFEISKKNALNPITQDIKLGNVRFVNNIFPFKGYMHNYGAIPQTWDDPTIVDKETGFRGDDDPIDICEIGQRVAKLGDVFEAKVLGALALIDDGELDWKVFVIDSRDPLAKEINDIGDIDARFPGLLESTRKWFKDYKIPDGKPENEFGFNGEFLNADKAIDVISHSNAAWKKLTEGQLEYPKLPHIENTTLNGSPGFIKAKTEDFITQSDNPDAEIPESVDRVYFV